MIPIKLKRLHPDAKIPMQMSAEAANFDFYCTEIEHGDNGMIIYKFGWTVEFPKEYKLAIVPRSSLTSSGWTQLNSPGQVDSDYRGELQLRLFPIPKESNAFYGMSSFVNYPEPYKVGDRVAQGFLEKVIPVQFEEVEELSETIRGTGGFGSTGKT